MLKGTEFYTYWHAHRKQSPERIKLMDFFGQWYENSKMASYANKPKIPKIIHQIWVGSEFPKKFKAWQQSWIEKHPDWEYRLWTDDDLKSLKQLYGTTHFAKARDYGEQANILRYAILHEYGGVYLDTDCACVRPLDELHHQYDFYTSMASIDCETVVNNAVIGAVPGHPILKACLDRIVIDKKTDQLFLRAGAQYFTKIVRDAIEEAQGNNVVLPAGFFHPVPKFLSAHHPFRITSNEDANKFIRPETIGIHYWTCLWYPPFRSPAHPE